MLTQPNQSRSSKAAPIRRERLRPTTSIVKSAIFNILLNGKGRDLTGNLVLDLFAGTGSLGTEALDKGAAKSIFVDHAFPSTKQLRRDLLASGLLEGTRFEVLCMDAFQAISLLARRGLRFDLVFIDPPYRENWIDPTLDRIVTSGLIAPSGIMVVEHDKREPISVSLVDWKKESRRYGDTQLTLITRK